jgi:hypothetical protein
VTYKQLWAEWREESNRNLWRGKIKKFLPELAKVKFLSAGTFSGLRGKL